MSKTRQCMFCNTLLNFIRTPEGKITPVDAKKQRRSGSAPLLKGKYYDGVGNQYTEDQVPNGIDVWRSHWGDCPGRDEARKS
jgi:hypothetical protein